jgi:Flp pilus assembly protein TadG
MQSNTLENYGCSKMLKQNSVNKRPFRHERAQAIVEFAIALPVLLMMLIGIFEVGRMVFIYAAVNNASREAARYASAYGKGDAPNQYVKYKDCASIRRVARNSAFFARVTNANIKIYYDGGPTAYPDGLGPNSTAEWASLTQCTATTGEDGAVNVESGDRVIVTVTAVYSPIVRLIPLRSRTFESTSARTILGIFELD